MDYKQFTKIVKLNQKQLKKYVVEKLRKKYDSVYVGDGYVYAQGDFPVMLVAHLDTVHKSTPKQICISGTRISSPQGIGGDDRCGVYSILKITDRVKCSVLFCEDEEVGCIGANKFLETDLANSLIGKFNYLIEIDRKGHNDAVFYDCDNPDFEEFITKEYFQTQYGSVSDISDLAPYLECSAVNLSSGYYKAHTLGEFVMTDELDTIIREIHKLLKRTDEDTKFEYIESKYSYSKYGYYGNYGKYDSWDDWYGYSSSKGTYYHVYYRTFNGDPKSETILAESKAEAVGVFLMDYPMLSYNDIEEVVSEYGYI